jgi:uncharacterized protein YcaQ
MNTEPMHFSLPAARSLLLAAQGLDQRSRRRATKGDVLAAIRRMGVLQIDTIHVVARSPYLVLWSRLGSYNPVWLDELLAEGSIFEYWAHEACFLPVEDYPLFRHCMIDPGSMGWKYAGQWIETNREHVDRVLDVVRERGPVRSSDFVRTDGKAGGWWEWKPEKRALESLFTAGELMVARRHNFQRIYDLRERVLPSWDDSQLPTLEETRRTLILNAVRALGVATDRWINDYYRTKRRYITPLIKQLVSENELIPASIEGIRESAYIHPGNMGLAEKAASGRLASKITTLLSPFDPVVWDRARALALFGFDYRIECYTPEPKRRYGYFTLPILRRGELIGRLDPKAHRRDGIFEIRALHLEPGVVADDEMIADVAGGVRECAAWHGTPEVVIRTAPRGVAGRLKRAIG